MENKKIEEQREISTHGALQSQPPAYAASPLPSCVDPAGMRGREACTTVGEIISHAGDAECRKLYLQTHVESRMVLSSALSLLLLGKSWQDGSGILWQPDLNMKTYRVCMKINAQSRAFCAGLGLASDKLTLRSN